MHLFISYPNQKEDIALNLRHRLEDLDIKAWAFSHDRTLAEDLWKEIEEKIANSRAVIFIASKHTDSSEGQQRELKLALERVLSVNPFSIFPVVTDDTRFSSLPEPINRVNGLTLSAYNVKTAALEIANRFYPEKFTQAQVPWKIPAAGDWLEICMLDPIVEEYFELKDLLYFRMVDPLGLLECYSPKLRGLFWISAKNVKAAQLPDEDGSFTREHVPYQFQIVAMYMMLHDAFPKISKKGS